MLNIGRNTAAGQELASFIERIERIRAEKKELGEQETAVIAEAKSRGYVPGPMRAVLKLRAMKPHDRQEAEAILETYLHALGMAPETPLHRQVGLIDVDTASREEVIEALKKFVPDNGAITVEAGGKPVRLVRDRTGEVSAKEVLDLPPPSLERRAEDDSPAAPDLPDVDCDGAEELGRLGYQLNDPIVRNPFPFGDPRRPRWDTGWRKESGGDGMGPDED